ncbi:VPLPA-CTERM sorting domain-containing protein [Aquicoccus sp. SCR17]|nr:VPLPA-CTERM sorting domain-containing protein [Carideicomes alvinocaridis]
MIDEDFSGGDYRSYDEAGTIDVLNNVYVPLEFDLDDGTHYGFARLNDLTLQDFAYETEAGVGIDTQPGPYDSVAPVPLPAGLPLLFVGVGALGVASRRKRKAASA